MRPLSRSLTLIATVAIGWAVAADAADIALSPVKVSKGYFRAENCEPEANPALINECVCAADIVKARVSGVSDAVATVIDNQLAQLPEQLAGESCAGKSVAAPGSDIQVSKVTANYRVVYQSPQALSVLVSYSSYGAGAAHPTSGSEGYTFDLATGKTINPPEVLTREQMKKANEFIRTELMRQYGNSLFDEAKDRAEPYLTDGSCEDCTLYYGKDGWNLRFQLYAIAPYASGEPEITIPTTIIPAPEALLTRK